jgi:hypothetical protein
MRVLCGSLTAYDMNTIRLRHSSTQKFNTVTHACGRLLHTGTRYGLRLKQRSPEAFKRMRAILGYYDLPTSAKHEEPRVESVNINMLQVGFLN